MTARAFLLVALLSISAFSQGGGKGAEGGGGGGGPVNPQGGGGGKGGGQPQCPPGQYAPKTPTGWGPCKDKGTGVPDPPPDDGVGNQHCACGVTKTSTGWKCNSPCPEKPACPPGVDCPELQRKSDSIEKNGGGRAVDANGEQTMSREEAEALLRGHNIKDAKPVETPKGAPPPEPPAPPPEGGVKLGGNSTASLYKGGPSATQLSLPQLNNSAADFLQSAANSSRRNDQRSVIRDTSEALKQEPNNTDALRMRGQALAKMRQHELAEKDLKKAVTLNSKDAKAWQYLAFNFLKQKNFEEALKAIDYALELDPNDPHAHMLRALILDALGRHEEALAELEIAARLDGRYQEKLDAALRGEKIYDPEEDLSDELLRKKRRAQQGGLPPWLPWAAGAAALGGMFMVAVLVLARRAVPAAAPAEAAAGPGATVVGGGGDSQRLSRLGGKYEILRPLGAGGMGEVHEAMDHTLGRVVALKSMAASLGGLGAKGRELFIREAKTVASLRHPAIVDIYEMIEESETLYLVFELVRGKTVAKAIAQQKRLTLEETLKILGPVCEALDFAHEQGLVHRDLKPANIMVTDKGHVKLMDFGIARSVAETRRKTPVGVAAGEGQASVTIIGTPAYMAPEALAGHLRKESDVFSLGATVYEMLTGNPPRLGASPASVAVPGLPPAVDAVLAQALEPDPEKRIKTPGEFHARLRAAAGA